MIVTIEDFRKEDTDAVACLWNRVMTKDGYKEMTPEDFASAFPGNPFFSPRLAPVLRVNGKISGFACGCAGDGLPLGDESGYLTCVVLDDEARTDENFTALLSRMERGFRGLGKKRSEVLFFNPIHLAWYIPGAPGHEHNNAPGAPVGSFFYKSLLKNGYLERARECAMYLNLDRFTFPEEIERKEKAAERAGYTVSLLDPNLHTGLREMLESLNNPLWTSEILQCAETGSPVLIAAHGREAVGFAGPVVRQENGRGYFSGIGVSPRHEGHGLGTVLFFRLCREFRAIGTDYMSLYTGLENPAKRIYEKAGFVPVKEFAVMRKELN